MKRLRWKTRSLEILFGRDDPQACPRRSVRAAMCGDWGVITRQRGSGWTVTHSSGLVLASVPLGKRPVAIAAAEWLARSEHDFSGPLEAWTLEAELFAYTVGHELWLIANGERQ